MRIRVILKVLVWLKLITLALLFAQRKPYEKSKSNTFEIIVNKNETKFNLANDFSRVIQQRFYDTQNPANCSEFNRKFIVCKTRACGFACQIHYFVYCLNEALKQDRILLIDDSDWMYRPNGFEKYFQPITETCQHITKQKTQYWFGIVRFSKFRKIEPDHQSNRNTIRSFSKYYVSDSDRSVIRQFHTSSFIWWNSQTVKYLMRLQPDFQAILTEKKRKVNSKRPIVGIHVRRTDKILEVDYIQTERYIQEAEKFFQRYQTAHPDETFVKTIFVATDDWSVISELKSKYPGYVFKWNDNTNNTSTMFDNRYTQNAFEDLLTDIYLLVDCDYVVCTLSSGICKLILELIQIDDPIHGLERVVSLDADYWFVIGNKQYETAIADYKPKNDQEIELKIGDEVKLHLQIQRYKTDTLPRFQKYLFDGFKNATNLRTKKMGLYPANITVD